MNMVENKTQWEYYRAIDIIKKFKTEETHEKCIDSHKAFDLAIQALEEAQKFKKQGITIESALDTMCDLAGAEGVIEQYQEFGTVEEVGSAMEKLSQIKAIIEKRDRAFNGQEFGATYGDLDSIIEEIRGIVDTPKNECFKTCKWHEQENIDNGYVCVNGDSEYVADWTEDEQCCEEWEKRE